MNNKYQGALDKIRQYMSPYDQALIPIAFKDLQELVDKEAPKKVAKEIEECKSYYKVSYECPTCKENLDFEKYAKRCPDCGQLLDWSENE